ncbi:patatin-like phospholipase family protein [Salinibius halmophilus]|uniref:patatin-like phospholipase family protein n=1 Tax=Salinibius halmophilus TaxID=1853216 RepID=UPI001F428F92|nr:patatin family protein [Salinibius halmophilus]
MGKNSQASNSNGKNALVVEGGAMRGIFAAGVLDAWIEQDFQPFDFTVGVSAGSTNLLGYLAGNHGRSKTIICDYATSDNFIDWRRFIRGGHFTDVSWLWHASYDEVELNLAHYFAGSTKLYVVTTSLRDGQARYFPVSEDNMHEIFPASCALPLAFRDQPRVADEPMTDGGVADSIPVIWAYEQGARDITVVLSKPLGYRKYEPKLPKLIKPLVEDFPIMLDALASRAERYNKALDFIENPPADCTVRVVVPPQSFKVERLTTDRAILEEGYQQGVVAGLNALKVWQPISIGHKPNNSATQSANPIEAAS